MDVATEADLRIRARDKGLPRLVILDRGLAFDVDADAALPGLDEEREATLGLDPPLGLGAREVGRQDRRRRTGGVPDQAEAHPVVLLEPWVTEDDSRLVHTVGALEELDLALDLEVRSDPGGVDQQDPLRAGRAVHRAVFLHAPLPELPVPADEVLGGEEVDPAALLEVQLEGDAGQAPVEVAARLVGLSRTGRPEEEGAGFFLPSLLEQRFRLQRLGGAGARQRRGSHHDPIGGLVHACHGTVVEAALHRLNVLPGLRVAPGLVRGDGIERLPAVAAAALGRLEQVAFEKLRQKVERLGFIIDGLVGARVVPIQTGRREAGHPTRIGHRPHAFDGALEEQRHLPGVFLERHQVQGVEVEHQRVGAA